MPQKVKFTPEPVGKVLKKYVVEAGVASQDELAKAMDVSRLTINQLLGDKRSVTADMALRLARVLSTSPEFWLDLQRDVDLARSREALEDALEDLPVLRKPPKAAR